MDRTFVEMIRDRRRDATRSMARQIVLLAVAAFPGDPAAEAEADRLMANATDREVSDFMADMMKKG